MKISTNYVGFAALAVLMMSCGSERLTSPQQTTQPDLDVLIDELRVLGAVVERSGPINQPFFPVSGVRLLVNGHQVGVYAFPTSEGAAAAAGGVSADGSSIVGNGVAYNVLWVGPPHFFLRDRLIVLYVGDASDILELLQRVLESQFAGA